MGCLQTVFEKHDGDTVTGEDVDCDIIAWSISMYCACMARVVQTNLLHYFKQDGLEMPSKMSVIVGNVCTPAAKPQSQLSV